MATFALVVGLLALLLAFLALKTAASLAGKIDRLESSVRRAEATAEESESRAMRLQQFLIQLAQGRDVDPEMIEEGRLFAEIDSHAAQRRIEEERPGDLVVCDVRTRQEVEGGHIEGALWIPIEELEQRYREVPKGGQVLMFCAVGGRSAAACDFLSTRGWTNLTNVAGGMSSYRGAVESGDPTGGGPDGGGPDGGGS